MALTIDHSLQQKPDESTRCKVYKMVNEDKGTEIGYQVNNKFENVVPNHLCDLKLQTKMYKNDSLSLRKFLYFDGILLV